MPPSPIGNAQKSLRRSGTDGSNPVPSSRESCELASSRRIADCFAQTVCVIVSAADRERLQAIIGDRNQPRKHIERARLVLASAEREPAQRVAAGVGVSRVTVWRWRQRYAEVGVEGLLRDNTRKPGETPIAAQTTARVVALTCTVLAET